MKNILLLHGWNYRNYSSNTKLLDAWDNRKKIEFNLNFFIDSLVNWNDILALRK